MEDYKKKCPICYEKLITAKYPGGVTRQCTASLGHTYYCEVNQETKNIKYVRVALNQDCNVFVGINFELQQTVIEDYSGKEKTVTTLNKVLELDFPFLENFRNKVSSYLRFQ